MFSAIGTLLYNPERTGLKKTDQINTLIVDLPLENIAEYYQWFLKKQYGEKFKLRAYMKESEFDDIYDAEYIDGPFKDLLAWNKKQE